MDSRDRKQIITDDGSTYEVESIPLPLGLLTQVIVVNDEMRAKAARLLPIAQKMAESKATRASFYRASERGLEVLVAALSLKPKKRLASRRRRYFWLQREYLLKASVSLLLICGEK